MDSESIFTLSCIVLGIATVLYGACGWIVSRLLQLLGLNVIIEGLGVRSARCVTIHLNQHCRIEISDLCFGFGTSLPWTTKSRLFSVAIGCIKVHQHLQKVSNGGQVPDSSTASKTHSPPSPINNDTPASTSSDTTPDKKPTRGLAVNAIISLLKYVDLLVRDVVVEVSGGSEVYPVKLKVDINTGLCLDMSSRKRKLLVQLRVQDIAVNLLTGRAQTCVSDVHLGLQVGVDINLHKALLPLSSVKVALQSPAVNLQDRAISAIKSLLPGTETAQPSSDSGTGTVAVTSSPTSTAPMTSLPSRASREKLVTLCDKMCKVLPDLLELSVEESNGRLMVNNGARQCDMEVSKILLSLKRDDSGLISVQLPMMSSDCTMTSPSSSPPSSTADVHTVLVPPCEASFMFSGLAVRVGERPPVLSLQRMQLTGKVCAEERPPVVNSNTSRVLSSSSSSSSVTTSTTTSTATSSSGSGVVSNNTTVCCVSSSLSVQSLRACCWYPEVKRWLALLPASTTTSSASQPLAGGNVLLAQDTTSSAVASRHGSQSRQVSAVQLFLAQLPAVVKVKAAISVSDVSLGIVSHEQFNISTIEKPQSLAVLAAANLQAECLEESLDSTATLAHRTVLVSCRLESAYIYNSRDSSKSQSSHFHHSNLLCPIVTRETVVSSSSDIETQATSSSVAVDKEDNVHAGSGSSSLWCCHDDRSVLPSSRCHLFGRPLEVAGISCKVSAQLPSQAVSPIPVSSSSTTAPHSSDEKQDVKVAEGTAIPSTPIDIAVDVSHLNLEVSRLLLASVCSCLDEFHTILSTRSQRKSTTSLAMSSQQGKSPSDMPEPSPAVWLRAHLCLNDVNVVAMQNEPGPVMALVRFSSVEITHCPAVVAMETASPANARSDTETSDPDPNDGVTADSVVTGAMSTSSLVTGGPQLTKAISASSCSSVVFESLSPGVCLDLRGFSVLSLAPADKKALSLADLAGVSQGILAVDKVTMAKQNKSITGDVPQLSLNWNTAVHKTLTVLAEQLLADLLHLKARIPTPVAAVQNGLPVNSSDSCHGDAGTESAPLATTTIPDVAVSVGMVTVLAQLDDSCKMQIVGCNLGLSNQLPRTSRSPMVGCVGTTLVTSDNGMDPDTDSPPLLPAQKQAQQQHQQEGEDAPSPSGNEEKAHPDVVPDLVVTKEDGHVEKTDGIADVIADVIDDVIADVIDGDESLSAGHGGLLRGFHISAGSVKWGFDDHDIVQLENVIISSPSDKSMKIKRAAFPSISILNERGALEVAVGVGNISFPYHYNFGVATDKLIGVFKLLKMLHKKGPRTKSGLGPDVILKVEDFTLELSDDPFEVKLGDNYALIKDENNEMLKRRKLLDTRINDLRAALGEMQAARKLDELLEALERTNSQVYCNRSKLLYDCLPMRTALLKLTVHCVEVAALADQSLQGLDNEIGEMKRIDSESPYPDGLEFSTLWARKMHATCAQLQARLRDYSQPLAIVDQLNISGSLVGAEEEPAENAIRTGTVFVGAPWKSVTVQRAMPALKFYHDLDIDVESLVVSYGNCWEPVLAQVSCAVDILTKESEDPSHPLPFWDKIRLLLHGYARVKSEQAIFFLAASSNPHNDSEKLEIVVKALDITLSNALIVFQGDLDVYTRTPSKYDECHIIHVPSVRISVHLIWDCPGNTNDHHVVMPWSPAKVKNLKTHDSFAAFRSRSLSLDIKVDIAAEQHQIRSFLYATSLRFFQKLQTVLVMATTPIRRGKLFDNTKPRKPTLGRFLKNLTIEGSMPSLHLLYWNSFACVRGISSHFGPITNSICLLVSSQSVAEINEQEMRRMDHRKISKTDEQSKVNTAEKPLIRRPASVWNIRSAKTVVDGVVMDTYESDGTMGTKTTINASEPENFAERHELLSVSRLEYFHEDDAKCKQSQDSSEKCYTHRLLVNDMKGLWTFENRQVVFGLCDSYSQSNVLKADLSAEALIGLRSGEETTPTDEDEDDDHSMLSMGDCVDGFERTLSHCTSQSSITSSTSSTGSASKRQLPGTPSFPLLEQLIRERDSKFTAEADEDRGEQGTPVLFGHKLCRADDLRELLWLVEFVNAQVVFKAPTVDGCVAVTTSSAVIMVHAHTPVVQRGEMVAKTTWTSLINDMQYFASVENIVNKSPWLPGSAMAQSEDPLADERNTAPKTGDLDIGGLLGGTYSASSNKLGAMLNTVEDSTVGRVSPLYANTTLSPMQVQRLIARCVCQVHYASFGGNPDPAHLPKQDTSSTASARSKSAKSRNASALSAFSSDEDPVDTFTISYPKLDIATNSEQYKLVLDLITQLLFYVDPKNKELADRCENKRFELSLSNVVDQRTPVMEKQRAVREQLDTVKALDRQTYDLWAEMDMLYEERMNIIASLPAGVLTEAGSASIREVDEALSGYQQQAYTLETAIAESKAALTEKSLDLRVALNSFRASQHGIEQSSESTSQSASIERRIEVWLDNSTWTIMQADGQLELAKVSLNNFLYVKIAKTDASGSHQFDLGWFSVQNLLPLLPSETYRDALKPSQENIKVERSKSLRVLLVEQAAVGGISVKEHFEVNIVPLTVHVTGRFYDAVRQFFFDDESSNSTASTPPGPASSGTESNILSMAPPAALGSQASTGSSGHTVASPQPSSLSADTMSVAGLDWDDSEPVSLSLSDGSMSSRMTGRTQSQPFRQSSGRSSGRRKTRSDESEVTVTTPAKNRNSSGTGRRKVRSSRTAVTDIETMKARASLNKTFTYIKVPQVQLVFSYKDESWFELEDAFLTLPTIEYHNSTFTYHDLLMQIKREVKIVVVPQAIKQKLRISHNTFMSDESDKSDKSTLLGVKVGKPLKGASRKLFSKIRPAPSQSQLTAPSGEELPQVAEEGGSIRQPVNLQDMIEQLSRIEESSAVSTSPTSL